MFQCYFASACFSGAVFNCEHFNSMAKMNVWHEGVMIVFLNSSQLCPRVWPFVNSSSEFRTALLVLYALSYAALVMLATGCQAHNVQVMLLMFDTFHGTAFMYLTDLCSRYSDHRYQRAATSLYDRWGTRFADSSFTVAGPALAWNSLPIHIWSIDSHSLFCCYLEAYLFTAPNWQTVTSMIFYLLT